MHPSAAALLRFFEYEHLPPNLREVSQPFHELAWGLADPSRHYFPTAVLEGNELTVCLRKLLEAKDCAVRAAL